MLLLNLFKKLPVITVISILFVTFFTNIQDSKTSLYAAESSDQIVELNNSLTKTNKKYRSFFTLNKRKYYQELVDIASKRRTLLLQEIEADPASFLKHALPAEEREQLPKELKDQGLIERDVETSGKLTAIIWDDFENRKSTTTYKIGEYNLYFAKGTPNLILGSEVFVRGLALDTELVLADTTETSLEVVKAAALDATGDKKIAVILFNFSDDRSQPFAKDAVYASIFGSGGYRSVNHYYQEVSFNQLSFSGSMEDILGWYELQSGSSDCDVEGWIEEVDGLINEEGRDLSSYDYRIYISLYALCPFSGVAFGNSHAYLNGWAADSGSATHEIGHLLGLLHASTLFCQGAAIDDYSNCQRSEYGDRFDVMGSGFHHLNSAHKTYLGWIPDSRVITATQSGTYTISYLEEATPGPQVLKIAKPNTNEYYYLEYRQPLGLDSSLPDTITRGVSVRIWRGDFTNRVPNTKLLDLTPETVNDFTDAALVDGATFTDPANGVEITQLDHGPESVTVQVSLRNPPPQRCPAPPPTPFPNAGKALYFNCLRWGESDYVTITDNDGRLSVGEEMTIEVWIRPEINVESATIFGKYASSLDFTIFSLGTLNYSYVPNRTRLTFSILTTDGFIILESGDYIIADDGSTWSHLAVSKKNEVVKLFVNGILKSVYALRAPVKDSAAATFSLGTHLLGGPIRTEFLGAVDELRISNKARDIEENWASGVYFEPLPVDENTLALWRFEGDLEDSSGNGNNGVGYGDISYTDGRVPAQQSEGVEIPLTTGWNKLRVPEGDKFTASEALTDISSDCNLQTAPSISRLRGDWWDTYFWEFGGVDFVLKKEDEISISVDKDCTWSF